jgi:hypothetical protein
MAMIGKVRFLTSVKTEGPFKVIRESRGYFNLKDPPNTLLGKTIGG